MTFDELLSLISEKHPETVPRGVEGHLRQSISEMTTERLLSLPVNDAVRIIVDSVEMINRGSVETIEALVKGKVDDHLGAEL